MKEMHMDYKYIKKYLGENWLSKQKIYINKEWVKRLTYTEINEPISYFFGKIDELIKTFENVEGFSKWAKEAKTTKTFEDCLFELMAMDNLLQKADSLKLKVPNPSNGSVPEALIKKGNDIFYVEMKRIRGLPKSIKNETGNLFKKASNKFKDSQGILFVGTFDFFGHPDSKKKILPEFRLLKRYIQLRFNRGFGSSIIAIVLTNFVIKTNFKKTSIEKEYHIIDNPQDKVGKPLKFFKGIFEVDHYIDI